jgi:hypothetical protein
LPVSSERRRWENNLTQEKQAYRNIKKFEGRDGIAVGVDG